MTRLTVGTRWRGYAARARRTPRRRRLCLRASRPLRRADARLAPPPRVAGSPSPPTGIEPATRKRIRVGPRRHPRGVRRSPRAAECGSWTPSGFSFGGAGANRRPSSSSSSTSDDALSPAVSGPTARRRMNRRGASRRDDAGSPRARARLVARTCPPIPRPRATTTTTRAPLLGRRFLHPRAPRPNPPGRTRGPMRPRSRRRRRRAPRS